MSVSKRFVAEIEQLELEKGKCSKQFSALISLLHYLTSFVSLKSLPSKYDLSLLQRNHQAFCLHGA